MSVKLKWINRSTPDSILVYRSTSPFDEASLPTALATIAGTFEEYTDGTVAASTTYYYRLGVKMTAAATILVSELVTITTSGSTVAAQLTLDFANSVFTLSGAAIGPTSYLSTVRSTEGAYTDNTGTVAWAVANAVRASHYEYIDGTLRRALLVEGNPATNQANAPTDPNGDASVGFTNMTGASNSAVAPDGNTSASLFLETTANFYHQVGWTATASPGAEMIWSLFVKPYGFTTSSNRRWLQIVGSGLGNNFEAPIFDPLTGDMEAPTNAGARSWTILKACGAIPFPNGWYRIWAHISTASGTGIAINTSTTPHRQGSAQQFVGVATVGYYAWGLQFEEAYEGQEGPSSLIRNGGATRSADVMQIDANHIGSGATGVTIRASTRGNYGPRSTYPNRPTLMDWSVDASNYLKLATDDADLVQVEAKALTAVAATTATLASGQKRMPLVKQNHDAALSLTPTSLDLAENGVAAISVASAGIPSSLLATPILILPNSNGAVDRLDVIEGPKSGAQLATLTDKNPTALPTTFLDGYYTPSTWGSSGADQTYALNLTGASAGTARICIPWFCSVGGIVVYPQTIEAPSQSPIQGQKLNNYDICGFLMVDVDVSTLTGGTLTFDLRNNTGTAYTVYRWGAWAFDITGFDFDINLWEAWNATGTRSFDMSPNSIALAVCEDKGTTTTYFSGQDATFINGVALPGSFYASLVGLYGGAAGGTKSLTYTAGDGARVNGIALPLLQSQR